MTYAVFPAVAEVEQRPVAKGDSGQDAASHGGVESTIASPIHTGLSKILPAVRRPIAAAKWGEELFVANSRTGTISVVDLRRGEVTREFPVAESIADMQLVPSEVGPTSLLVLDRDRHTLLIMRIGKETLIPEQSISLPFSPVRLAMSSDQETLAVSSLWSRQVSLLRRSAVAESAGGSLAGGQAGEQAGEQTEGEGHVDTAGRTSDWQVRTSLELPFSPRELLFHPESRWLVAADGFAGRLAVIDCEQMEVCRVLSLGGQHLHGLANRHDGQAIWITMQQLNSYRETTHEEVFWGRVLRNVLVELPWDRITNRDSSNTDSDGDLSVNFLGRPQEGAGDPGRILTLGEETTLIALAGIHEIAVRTRHTAPLEQRRVGRRPVALVADEEGERAYVVNQMDDSISVLDLQRLHVLETIPLGPERELSMVERGEEWFYDAGLSLDGWYSCHSCHTDGHTTGELNDNLGDDTFGAPKRILSLLGVGETGPWAWHGKVKELEEQVAKSIRETMQGEPPSEEQVAALTAFVRQLPPPPTGQVRRQLDPALRERGEQLFHRQGCVDCHAPPAYTSPDVYNVGLEDEVGRARFNPPSLRGVAHRDRLFHDNRASSLGAVFSEHGHPSGELWSDEEVAALVEFLFGL